MKKLATTLMSSILFSFYSYAQDTIKKEEKTESAIIIVKSNEEVIKYKFDSIKDFDENSDKILDDISLLPETEKVAINEVTVEIVITVNCKSKSTTISTSITTSCLAIADAVKKIRTQLIAIGLG